MTTTKDSSYLYVLTDEALLEMFQGTLETVADAQAGKGRVEQEIFRRMEEQGATGIPSDRYKCDLKVTYTYDPSILVSLKETFSDSDLATCWTPAHPETVDVPEKFNMTKLLPVAKRYGDKALSVVERAKVENRRSLDFGVK